jgi:hypothetical protein
MLFLSADRYNGILRGNESLTRLYRNHFWASKQKRRTSEAPFAAYQEVSAIVFCCD